MQRVTECRVHASHCVYLLKVAKDLLAMQADPNMRDKVWLWPRAGTLWYLCLLCAQSGNLPVECCSLVNAAMQPCLRDIIRDFMRTKHLAAQESLKES